MMAERVCTTNDGTVLASKVTAGPLKLAYWRTVLHESCASVVSQPLVFPLQHNAAWVTAHVHPVGIYHFCVLHVHTAPRVHLVCTCYTSQLC